MTVNSIILSLPKIEAVLCRIDFARMTILCAIEQMLNELVSCQLIRLILLFSKHLHELYFNSLKYDVIVNFLNTLHPV